MSNAITIRRVSFNNLEVADRNSDFAPQKLG